eukprot:scpid22011/ scgid19206/ 
MQQILNEPSIKLKEPSSVRWLSHEGSVRAFRKSFKSVVRELRRQADEKNDAAAAGWLRKVKTFRFVASLLLLGDVFPILATLSKTFQLRNRQFRNTEASADHCRHLPHAAN